MNDHFLKFTQSQSGQETRYSELAKNLKDKLYPIANKYGDPLIKRSEVMLVSIVGLELSRLNLESEDIVEKSMCLILLRFYLVLQIKLSNIPLRHDERIGMISNTNFVDSVVFPFFSEDEGWTIDSNTRFEIYKRLETLERLLEAAFPIYTYRGNRTEFANLLIERLDDTKRRFAKDSALSPSINHQKIIDQLEIYIALTPREEV